MRNTDIAIPAISIDSCLQDIYFIPDHKHSHLFALQAVESLSPQV